MSGLFPLPDTVLDGLMGAALDAACIALAVLVLERALGRWLGARTRTLLWGLVALRLCLPVLPPDPFDPDAGGREAERGEDLAARSDHGTEAAGFPELPALDSSAWRAGPETAPPDPGPVRDPAPRSMNSPGPQPVSRASSRESVAHESGEPSPWSPRELAGGAWILGVAFFGLRLLLVETCFRRRLRRDARPADVRTEGLVDECRETLGVRRPVRCVFTHLVEVPAVTGILRPTVLLPDALLDELDETGLRHVLLHELCHVRRGDVLANAGLALVSVLHWYHPLWWLARRRLIAAREELRDEEVVRSLGPPRALDYARTLLDLVPRPSPRSPRFLGAQALSGRRELRRRILMLTRPRTPSLSRALIAGTLLGGLGWLSLTATAGPTPRLRLPQPRGPVSRTPVSPRSGPQDDARAEPDAARAKDWRRIPVQKRETEEGGSPAEDALLREKIEEGVLNVDFENSSLSQIAQFLRDSLGVSVVLEPSIREQAPHLVYSLRLPEMPATRVLDLLCDFSGIPMAWGVRHGVLWFGEQEHVPVETRFYDVRDLLRELRQEEAASTEEQEQFAETQLEELMELLPAFVGSDRDWEHPGSSVQAWNGVLCVNQTAATHDRVQTFLERLLNGGRLPPDREPQEVPTRIEEALSRRLDLRFEDEELSVVAEALQALSGVAIVLDPELLEETDSYGMLFDLELKGVDVGQALRWVARQMELECGLSVGLQVTPQGVFLRIDGRDPRLGYYDVSALLQSESGSRDRDWEQDHLVMVLEEGVLDVDDWDVDRVEMRYWHDLLLVRHCEEAQTAIGAYLRGLGRTLEERRQSPAPLEGAAPRSPGRRGRAPR